VLHLRRAFEEQRFHAVGLQALRLPGGGRDEEQTAASEAGALQGSGEGLHVAVVISGGQTEDEKGVGHGTS
jgi:hypothetical protein